MEVVLHEKRMHDWKGHKMKRIGYGMARGQTVLQYITLVLTVLLNLVFIGLFETTTGQGQSSFCSPDQRAGIHRTNDSVGAVDTSSSWDAHWLFGDTSNNTYVDGCIEYPAPLKYPIWAAGFLLLFASVLRYISFCIASVRNDQPETLARKNCMMTFPVYRYRS